MPIFRSGSRRRRPGRSDHKRSSRCGSPYPRRMEFNGCDIVELQVNGEKIPIDGSKIKIKIKSADHCNKGRRRYQRS